MIFGSFGLLVVALALLIAAIAKSSVAIGIASLACTACAVGCLLAANAFYRKAHGAGRLGAGDRLDSSTRAEAPTPAQATMVMFPQMAMAGGPPNGHGANGVFGDGGGWGRAPVENYDRLSVAQAVSTVDMLNIDQLHSLRRYEVENAGRKPVLAAIDARVAAIVSLRRTLEA